MLEYIPFYYPDHYRIHLDPLSLQVKTKSQIKASWHLVFNICMLMKFAMNQRDYERIFKCKFYALTSFYVVAAQQREKTERNDYS